MSRFHLALTRIKGLGAVAAAKVLAEYPEAERAFGASVEKLYALGLSERQAKSLASFNDFDAVDQVIEKARKLDQRIVAFDQEDFPPSLRTLHAPPSVLFVKGKYDLAADLAVCIVGTRHPTSYGEEVTRRLGAILAKSNICTVSGGARGIDACAHQGALEMGGPTIAVFGCGLDIVYPKEHADLFAGIVESGGALFSELPPGTPPDRGTFPVRNRLLAGLGRACVVVEAGERSGALITANYALEQGKTVLAVPGPIDRAQSRGTNRLIRDGAKPLLEVLDVVEEVLGEQARRMRAEAEILESVKAKLPPPQGVAGQVWQALGKSEAVVDSLVNQCGLTSAQVNTALIELELAGRVKRLPGGRYTVFAEVK